MSKEGTRWVKRGRWQPSFVVVCRFFFGGPNRNYSIPDNINNYWSSQKKGQRRSQNKIHESSTHVSFLSRFFSLACLLKWRSSSWRDVMWLDCRIFKMRGQKYINRQEMSKQASSMRKRISCSISGFSTTHFGFEQGQSRIVRYQRWVFRWSKFWNFGRAAASLLCIFKFRVDYFEEGGHKVFNIRTRASMQILAVIRAKISESGTENTVDDYYFFTKTKTVRPRNPGMSLFLHLLLQHFFQMKENNGNTSWKVLWWRRSIK